MKRNGIRVVVFLCVTAVLLTGCGFSGIPEVTLADATLTITAPIEITSNPYGRLGSEIEEDELSGRQKLMLGDAEDLMEHINVSGDEYDDIRALLRTKDGAELTDQEITNYLLNTQLYRAALNWSDEFYYSFYNDEYITVSFQTSSGEWISNDLKYKYYDNGGLYQTGGFCFTAYDIDDVERETQIYPFQRDFANGDKIRHDTDDASVDSDRLMVYSYVELSDEQLGMKVFEDAKEDTKNAFLYRMNLVRGLLKNMNEGYDIQWDRECKSFSVYYEESIESKGIYTDMTLAMLSCSIAVQALNENPDWHLSINFYRYDTGEFIKTETIR